MTSELRLDRLEFQDISLRVNSKAKRVMESHVPQLRIDFDKYNLYHRSNLLFPDAEVADPRHFALTYGVKLESKNPDEPMPYDVEIEALALLHYLGDDLSGAERFRAVRFSGYQMLHGAIREMVANLTARSRHGLLQLPSRNFNGIAKREADEDEATRSKLLNGQLADHKPIEAKVRAEPMKQRKPETDETQTPASPRRRTVVRKRSP